MRRLPLALLPLLATSPTLAADPANPDHYIHMDGEAEPALRGSIDPGFDGFYFGANGGSRYFSDHELDVDGAGQIVGLNATYHYSGASLGAHLGYGWTSGHLYYGLEGDIEKSFATGAILSGVVGRTDIAPGIGGSMRLRLGYVIGSFLPYITGGASVLSVRYVDKSSNGVESYSKMPTGWTIGAGLEWAMNRSVSARLEYRYSNYAPLTLNSAVAYPGVAEQHKISDSAVRFGLSYRFGVY